MLSESEERSLRVFCKVDEEIHACRFVRTFEWQSLTITIDIDPNKNRLPTFDMDDFRSFMTLFRKIHAQKEPTHLFRVMKIIKRFAPLEMHASFKLVIANLNREADNPPVLLSIGKPGSEVPMTPRRMCDIVFNGMIFHSDEKYEYSVEQLLEIAPFAFTFFLSYVMQFTGTASRYSALLKHFDYFKEVNTTHLPAE